MMTSTSACCAHLVGSGEQASPFAKVIALGYYDGPTAGIVQCHSCATAYKFDLLMWDEDQDRRIFTLTELPIHAWSSIVNILSPYTSPTWPIWVPLWQFPTEEETTMVNKQIENILQQAKPPVCIIVCSNLLETITRAKYVTAPDLATVTDWFAFLEQ
jgi:hypothetical protein